MGFFPAAGTFFDAVVFFAGAAFRTVSFFLLAVTGFLFAAAGFAAFFAALFFRGTAFAMNLHHCGLSHNRIPEKPHYGNMDYTTSYTLWIMQLHRKRNGVFRFGIPPSLLPVKRNTDGRDPIPGTRGIRSLLSGRMGGTGGNLPMPCRKQWT